MRRIHKVRNKPVRLAIPSAGLGLSLVTLSDLQAKLYIPSRAGHLKPTTRLDHCKAVACAFKPVT